MAAEPLLDSGIRGAEVAAVGAGGFLGTLLRALGLLAFPPAVGEIPWITLAENLSGAFLLGVLAAALLRLRPASRLLQLFLLTGVLGSYTTFSALALDGALLLGNGSTGTAGAYLALSVCGGITLAAAGIAIGERFPSNGAGDA